uniref:Uncharacterized protein n=1 Tax=Strombidinopsis acuminata TaxID=141414 RepID=A0A7S3VZN6_9SPIT|mmetsp:Transcript_21615/g.59412  ORF Transcript_21615/g.59412 Transcript_21615/m.59412 type:complete len:193 (-) Transcript_21615:140-718(-)
MRAAPLGGFTPETLLAVPKNSADFSCTLSCAGQSASLHKARGESVEHVLLKALVWAMYLPIYPTAICEDSPIARLKVAGSSLRYHPDVYAANSNAPANSPLWWAECGSVSVPKLRELAEAYPSTSFTVAKWARSDLRGYATSLCRDLPASCAERFEVVSFPADAPERFINEEGQVSVGFDDLLDRVTLSEVV